MFLRIENHCHLKSLVHCWKASQFNRALLLKKKQKEVATHSNILAWKIPWIEEPGRLQSMGLQRVGHNSVTFTILQLKINQFKYNKFLNENEKMSFIFI